MNLALLNPCRQADRIDSTLSIPQALHPPRPSATTAANDSAYSTSSSSRKGKQRQRRPQTRRRRGGGGGGAFDDDDDDGASTTASEALDEQPEEEEDNADSEGGGEDLMDEDDTGVHIHDDDEEEEEELLLDDASDNYNTATHSEEIEEDDDNEEAESYWTACYAVSFHRRGAFLASGHASGLVTVHDFLGRTMSALYWPPPPIALRNNGNGGEKTKKKEMNRSAVLRSFYFGKNGNGGGNTGNGGDGDGSKLLRKNTHQDSNTNHNNKSGKMKTRKGQQKKTVTKLSGEGESTSQIDKSNAITTSSSDDYDEVNEEGGSSSSSDSLEYQQQQLVYRNGVTSLSWDRRGRTLLAGAIGDTNLRLMDNTHPLVATDCTDAVRRQFLAGNSGGKKGSKIIDDDESPSALANKKAAVIAKCPPFMTTISDNTDGEGKRDSVTIRMDTVSLGRARLLRSNIVDSTQTSSSSSGRRSSSSLYSLTPVDPSSTTALPCTTSDDEPFMSIPTRRHLTLVLQLPQPLGGPVQLHPRQSHAGLACMMDGSLALFYMPPMAYYEALPSLLSNNESKGDGSLSKMKVDDDDTVRKQWVIDALEEGERDRVGNLLFLVPPPSDPDDSSQYFITCAAFGKDGDIVWAVTKCGTLLAFRIELSMISQLRGDSKDTTSTTPLVSSTPILQPTLCVNIPGGSAAYQIIMSRNGKLLLINSADCSLRLYNVQELCEKFDEQNADVTPRFVFQDNITKAPWASCDFSGDGEYVVGGSNPGDNYKLFLLNCVTGELVDQLTGPISSLYSISCHPTRPFIAVGTSDDIIDVWGSRIDWVAFAPDFQALQQNELYEEKEDEFDIVDDEDVEDGADMKLRTANNQISTEDEDVDIMAIGKIPAFDSDSEEETSVFYFDTKVEKILSEK